MVFTQWFQPMERTGGGEQGRGERAGEQVSRGEGEKGRRGTNERGTKEWGDLKKWGT